MGKGGSNKRRSSETAGRLMKNIKSSIEAIDLSMQPSALQGDAAAAVAASVASAPTPASGPSRPTFGAPVCVNTAELSHMMKCAAPTRDPFYPYDDVVSVGERFGGAEGVFLDNACDRVYILRRGLVCPFQHPTSGAQLLFRAPTNDGGSDCTIMEYAERVKNEGALYPTSDQHIII